MTPFSRNTENPRAQSSLLLSWPFLLVASGSQETAVSWTPDTPPRLPPTPSTILQFNSYPASLAASTAASEKLLEGGNLHPGSGIS